MAEEIKETKSTRRRRKVQEEAPVEVVEAEAAVAEEKVTKTPAEEKVDPALELLKQQNDLMKAEIEALKAQIANAQPQIIQIAPDTERIEFLWLAPVANENELLIAGGMYGKITGQVGNFSIPKNELSRMLDAEMRKYIETRWLIVLGGLDENERRMYGVDYKPGEVLDKEAFMRLLDIGKDIVGIYERLCDASRDVVAKLYFEAWGDPSKKRKVHRNVVVEMNKIAPKAGFKAILEGMNQEEIEQ